MSKLLIVIPAHNEEENIVPVVENLTRHYPEYDYIVVNDGSRDKTAALCRAHGYRLIDLPINLGLAGAFQTGFDDGFFTAEAGFRGDHFAACQNVVAVAAKCGDEKGRRGEFRPSLFRVLVQLTANVDQLIVISAEHVDLLLFKQKRTRKTPFGNRRIKRRRIEMQRCTSAVRDRTRPHSVRKNNRPSAGNEATDGFEKKNTSKEAVAKALLWQRFALSQKFVTPFQLYPCFSNNNKEVIMSACAFR